MKTKLLLLMVLVLAACSKQPAGTGNGMGSLPSLKISVLKDGSVFADGKPTVLADLDHALADLKRSGGSVWYYREAGQAEPPPQAMEVIKMVVEKSLPITLSTKPDFSDYVGEDGRPHQRKK